MGLASEQIVTFAYPSSANADENQGKFDYSHHCDMSRGQRSRRESICTNMERNVKRSFCICNKITIIHINSLVFARISFVAINSALMIFFYFLIYMRALIISRINCNKKLIGLYFFYMLLNMIIVCCFNVLFLFLPTKCLYIYNLFNHLFHCIFPRYLFRQFYIRLENTSIPEIHPKIQ